MATHQEGFDGKSSKGACWNAHANNYTRQIITSWPSHGMSHAMMLPCILSGRVRVVCLVGCICRN
jgi:hypothetical protein